MNHPDKEKLYHYYKGLWEQRKKGGRNPSQEAWDGRAADWERELEKSPDFFEGLNRRVEATGAWLRGRGLLGPESRVADIGCGPGRFAVSFAGTAKEVTCVDISGKMLEMAAAYAKECGCSNLSFLQADFSALDVERLGWEKKFDLVFASLTPAVSTVEDMEKLMRMSRGYCFNSSSVRWEDQLERQVGREVFGREEPGSGRGRDAWFYAFFNLLWLMGYYPETGYYCAERTVRAAADEDRARYYAKCFSPDMTAREEEVRRVHRFLQRKAGPDGCIAFREERWYGWILWDVRRRNEGR